MVGARGRARAVQRRMQILEPGAGIEYSFDQPLKVGDRVVFGDMAQYSFVKNTTFNGTPLPDLGVLEKDGTYRLVRRFGYEDFARRVGA